MAYPASYIGKKWVQKVVKKLIVTKKSEKEIKAILKKLMKSDVKKKAKSGRDR